MTKREQARVKRLAWPVRQWAEQRADTSDCCGMCVKASDRLAQKLQRKGYPAVVRVSIDKWGCGHAFVTVGAWLIDVTATQFLGNAPKVVLCRLNDVRGKHWFWAGNAGSFDNADALRRYLLNVDWSYQELPEDLQR